VIGGQDENAADNGQGQNRDDSGKAHHRLVVYGTLAPGRPNHSQLEALDGRWSPGQLRGRLVDAGWGASLGYPGLVLDPHAGVIDVQVFESADLPAHWSRLDEFEGPGYRRVVTKVRLPADEVDASVYVLRVPENAAG
jgi:gamma-glutamylcyclotransferase (GGCT)/AIG2-like uncharacterized protein YtfP